MRVIGIVTEVRQPPGLYMREGLAKAEDVATAWGKWLAAAAAVGIVGPGIAGAALGVMFAPVAMTFAAFLPQAYLYRTLYDYLFATPPLVLVPNALGGEGSPTVLERAIVISAALLGGHYGDHNAPVFHGLFGTKDALEKVMRAEGGNVDLIIVDQGTANATWKHPRGGQFSPGLYLPHPKDPSVLVAAASYAADLLREVRSEWTQMFEALGAKSVTIADSTNAKAAVGGAKNVAGVGNVGAELRGAYGAAAVDESTYAAGTFDPERAVNNRRWIHDFPEMLDIVEGRVRGNQASWRRTVKVDATFGVSAEVLGVFKLKFEGGFARQYEAFVEFHPKPTSITRQGS